MIAKRSTLKMKNFVKKRKDPADHDVSHESLTVNEADRDFRIPKQPPVVKYAQNTSVRQLIQKIENHPNRHALRRDLRQNQSFNPVQNQNKFEMWVTSNHVKCSRRNPKRSAQCIHQTGISVHSTARAGISFVKKEGPIKNSPIFRWTFSFNP